MAAREERAARGECERGSCSKAVVTEDADARCDEERDGRHCDKLCPRARPVDHVEVVGRGDEQQAGEVAGPRAEGGHARQPIPASVGGYEGQDHGYVEGVLDRAQQQPQRSDRRVQGASVEREVSVEERRQVVGEQRRYLVLPDRLCLVPGVPEMLVPVLRALRRRQCRLQEQSDDGGHHQRAGHGPSDRRAGGDHRCHGATLGRSVALSLTVPCPVAPIHR